MIGIFYNEETNPVVTGFNLTTLQPRMRDNKEKYFSYQIGIKVVNNFLVEGIHSPAKEEFTIAFSYLLK